MVMVISAWLVGGFFTLEKFNEMTYEVERLSSNVERLNYVNLKLCRELHPTKLMFFPSTEKMNWFEANRVKLQRFSAFLRFFLLSIPFSVLLSRRWRIGNNNG